MFPSPLGEKVPVEPEARLRRDGRMRGLHVQEEVAPHQFGRMTYDLANTVAHMIREA